MANNKKEIIEELASIEHDQWEYWAKDIMEKESLSKERLDRWKKECFMPYSELSEEMKGYDREYAEKVYKIFEKYNKESK